MNTYQQSVEAAEEVAVQKAQAEQDAHEFARIYAAFPALVRNEANNSIMRDYCGSAGLSREVVEYGLTHDDLVSRLVVQSDTEARAAFIDTIVKLSGGSPASQAFQRKQLQSRVRNSGQNVYDTQTLQHKANEAEKRETLRDTKPDALADLTRTSTDSNLVGERVAAENELKKTHRLIAGRYYPPVPQEITRKAIIAASPAQQRQWNRNYHEIQIEEAFRTRRS
jgi:hypothetical protein